MMEGEGLEAVFPPMAKNPNLALKEKMIQVTLKGMRGELKVNGKSYNTDMAPVALSDLETADVLNYMRNSWGNKYPQILAKEIQPALKVKVKDFIAY
jgi:nitrite reductase (NO-forming)